MQDYLSRGHMEVVEDEKDTGVYYLPHHAIVKLSSTTAKTRVVFDGSATSSSGVSLNDITMRGPTVQSDLYSIILCYRLHSVVLTADVEKMYRQVRMDPADCDFQRIVYRSRSNLPLTHYRLLTVTYGTKSAPFLATRCLTELANQVLQEPEVKRAIKKDSYVDDFISGATSVKKCIQLYQNASKMLLGAGIPLRKWCSKSQEVLNNISASNTDPTYLLSLNDEDTVSALGLLWQPALDQFKFSSKEWVPVKHMTKRTLLSYMNRVYDPLGFLTPILIKDKIFMQQLWSLKLDWETHLTADLQSRWELFYRSFEQVALFNIP
ncbi:uncharacterized protein LOC126894616 [Daktulosphaira vitifoliae]|uniref:uncharacterized protein LOC126894616 n=1 Tax=Daktulosphaira vitifoliae TaxID=58002 RepID=UPI0021AAFDDF|nr:uncharacterized protein LOC126894616 [Daktulosphaira vitifoliae]